MNAEAFDPGAPFAPRPTRCTGVIEHGGWRLKLYEITAPGDTLDAGAYEAGMRSALNVLPSPAHTGGRPGLGFVIQNQGRDPQGRRLCYLVVCWWDNANELFIETFINGEATRGAWTEARGNASICVWDLGVIWHEREAFAGHMLTDCPDPQAYLDSRFSQPAARR